MVNELEQHIKQRAQTKFGASQSKGKGHKTKKQDIAVQLTPENLEIIPDTFHDEHDLPVAMVSLDNIKPDMRGIAIIAAQDAHLYLEEDHNLSTDAFAVVTIGNVPNAPEERVVVISWTALYRPTMEPIILNGMLINLGDVRIDKKALPTLKTMPKMETIVFRVQVFRDSCDGSWADFAAGPVKAIINTVPTLLLCQTKDCKGNCRYFHPSVEEATKVAVLDVWSWKWLTMTGRQSKQSDAEVFNVYIRMPSSALESVLAYSGSHGIFFEPRPGQECASPFAVVWLAKDSTVEDALRFKRKESHVLGIARMGTKIGLRVRSTHESQLLRVVYPDRALISCNIKSIYEMGPLPHGNSKDQVAQMIALWCWRARPLKVVRSTPAGKYWEIGAEEPPPSPVLNIEAGDITITIKKEIEGNSRPQAWFNAATKTLTHLKKGSQPTWSSASSSSGSRDPWSHGADPWANYAKKNSTKADVPTFPENAKTTPGKTDRYAAMEAKLTSQLQEQFESLKSNNDFSMDEPTDSKLQVEVQELQAQNTKFEAWFGDMGKRMTALETNAHEQNQKIQQLGSMVQTQSQVTQQMQTEMGSLQSNLIAAMHRALDEQTDRLEKRQRSS